MAKTNATVTRRANGRTFGQVAKALGTTTEVLKAELEKAVMTCEEHYYSVAKDVKRLEHILKDSNGQRITVRGHKDSWMFISNKELVGDGWEKHERKTGTWWGKEFTKAKAEELIKNLSGKEITLE